ncbi:MAG: endonuclease/exonuclease/phosphatase family protein [Pseudomonadota bacterium]
MSACAEPDRDDTPQRNIDRPPEISVESDTDQASLELSVLIYNVAGLPWPLGCGKRSRTTDADGERIPIACDRSAAMAEIGTRLAAMRTAGEEPDIIMLQEAFIEAASEIPDLGGYRNWVTGPTSEDLGPEASERAPADFLDKRSFLKGEKLGKWQSSGLLIASDYPIHVRYSHPFPQWECAGYDCLANKGILTVELDIPGMPDPLAITTTHFNSRGASGVSRERALVAHSLQVDETNDYLESLERLYLPFIWGGDLNMRRDSDRMEYFVERAERSAARPPYGSGLKEVSSFCVSNSHACEMRSNWGTDTPWWETQDLQGWSDGARVVVQPIRMEKLFDEAVDGVMLSDHDGVLVFYRLSWPAALTRPF